MLEKSRAQIIKYHKQLNAKINQILRNPSTHDPVYTTLQRLFRRDSPWNLSRAKDERFGIRELARKRFDLGYPPRKNADTSIGDAINWEWIVDCAIRSGKHIVLVTRDTDFGVIHERASYLNDWLRQEFAQRVSTKRKIVLTDRLSSGLQLVQADVTPEMEEEEGRVIALLRTLKGGDEVDVLSDD